MLKSNVPFRMIDEWVVPMISLGNEVKGTVRERQLFSAVTHYRFLKASSLAVAIRQSRQSCEAPRASSRRKAAASLPHSKGDACF